MTDALLARCAAMGASTWSDALDACGIDGVLRGLPRRAGTGRFAGWAVTARETAGPLGAYPRGDFAVGRMVASLAPGLVLMVDMGGADVSTFGGMAALAAARQGAAAVVIDGGCRDVDEIVHSGLWLASRSVTPTSGKRRVRLEAMGETVTVGGIGVAPDDLVLGDDTGIVVVPRARLDQVLAAAERMQATDQALAAGLAAGKSFAEAASAADYI